MAKFTPLHDRLLVRRIEEGETTRGGIIIAIRVLYVHLLRRISIAQKTTRTSTRIRRMFLKSLFFISFILYLG